MKRRVNRIGKGWPIDIMLKGRYIAILRLPYYAADYIIDGQPAFEQATISNFVLKKLPTLKGEDFKIRF